MARITAPVSGYSGKVVGVDFVDGSAETDDERAIDYFSRQGYKVEGADGFGAFEDETKLAPIGETTLSGTPYADPDSGPYRDAADPRNDMVPVGGVKSDGTVVAGKGRGKRVAAAEASGAAVTGNPAEGAPAPAPGQPVQELGDPETKSATPAGTNPVEATTEQGETKADEGTADTGSESASGSKSSSSKAGA